jgi:SAM-dependent methyltransferase
MISYEEAIARCYSTWGKTYYEEYYGSNSPYPPVHTELLRSILKENKVNNLLDAGCGPASFLRDVIREGWDLYGFDLTPEMVEEGKKVFADNNLDPERIWKGSIIEKSSFRVPVGNTPEFDAAVCDGVLPHILEEHDVTVIENLRDIYNIDEVDKVITEYAEIVESGIAKENHMMFLWQLVKLNVWMEGLSKS